MKKEEPKTHGGKREGAGRKAKSDVAHRVTFRCASDVYEILKLEENMTAFIESAIRDKYRRSLRF